MAQKQAQKHSLRVQRTAGDNERRVERFDTSERFFAYRSRGRRHLESRYEAIAQLGNATAGVGPLLRRRGGLKNASNVS
jgi:hypothetical protein